MPISETVGEYIRQMLSWIITIYSIGTSTTSKAWHTSCCLISPSRRLLMIPLCHISTSRLWDLSPEQGTTQYQEKLSYCYHLKLCSIALRLADTICYWEIIANRPNARPMHIIDFGKQTLCTFNSNLHLLEGCFESQKPSQTDNINCA